MTFTRGPHAAAGACGKAEDSTPQLRWKQHGRTAPPQEEAAALRASSAAVAPGPAAPADPGGAADRDPAGAPARADNAHGDCRNGERVDGPGAGEGLALERGAAAGEGEVPPWAAELRQDMRRLELDCTRQLHCPERDVLEARPALPPPAYSAQPLPHVQHVLHQADRARALQCMLTNKSHAADHLDLRSFITGYRSCL